MAWLVSTRLGRLLAVLGGLLAGFLAAFLAGQSEGRRGAAEDGLRRYRETRREMDHADASRGDPAADLDWLRDRAGR